MGSDCATKQKNSPAGRRAGKDYLNVNTLPLDSQAATKVIAKACSWADRRKAAAAAPEDQKAREVGRYQASGRELAEAVEKYRKAEQQAGSCPP